MLRSFVVALLSLISGSALAVDTTFLLVNSTSYPINQMSISQHDMQMWSPNLFRGPVIKPGESRQIVIPASQLVCQVDMRLGFADGTPPATWQSSTPSPAPIGSAATSSPRICWKAGRSSA